MDSMDSDQSLSGCLSTDIAPQQTNNIYPSVPIQLPMHSFIQCSIPANASLSPTWHIHSLSTQISVSLSLSFPLLSPSSSTAYTPAWSLSSGLDLPSVVAHAHHAAAPPPRIAFTRRCRSVLGLAASSQQSVKPPLPRGSVLCHPSTASRTFVRRGTPL
jgi:hypothetical protein